MKIKTTFSSFVPPNRGGWKLLDYLADRFAYLTREEWSERILEGRVTLDGEPTSADASLKNGMKVTSQIEHDEPDIPEEVEVIHLGDEIGVFGKSAEVPVSRTGQIIWNTFVQQVRRKLNNPEVRLLHRLDRETSGLLLCALSKEAAARHQKNLSQILLRKFYLAVVRGDVEWEEMECNAPLREAKELPARAKMVVDEAGKPSYTHFWRIERAPEQSLLLAELKTGRKHQIRAHLAHLGHPLVGDKLYTGKGEAYIEMAKGELTLQQLENLGSPHHLLHSWAALISIPGEEKEQLFFSQLFSQEFQKALKQWPHALQNAEKRVESRIKEEIFSLF